MSNRLLNSTNGCKSQFSFIALIYSNCEFCLCRHQSHLGDKSPWLHPSKQETIKHGRAEFFGRFPRMDSNRKMWNSPITSPACTNSPVKGIFFLYASTFFLELHLFVFPALVNIIDGFVSFLMLQVWFHCLLVKVLQIIKITIQPFTRHVIERNSQSKNEKISVRNQLGMPWQNWQHLQNSPIG